MNNFTSNSRGPAVKIEKNESIMKKEKYDLIVNFCSLRLNQPANSKNKIGKKGTCFGFNQKNS